MTTEITVTDWELLGDSWVQATVVFPDGHAERVSVPWSEHQSVREKAIPKAREQRMEREKKTAAAQYQPGCSKGP